MRLVALIPAHNEAATIAAVVEGIRAEGISRVLVVDDGSTDGTGNLALEAGAQVLRLEPGQGGGKGQALRAGVTALQGENFDFFTFLDGDGQHDPRDLRAFIQHLGAHPETDFLIGSRKQNRSLIPKSRWRTNALGTWILGRIAGVRWEDSQSGFRMIRKTLVDSLDLRGRGFAIEMEMAMKAADHRVNWAHIPIQAIYHGGGSHFRPIWDTVKIAFFSLEC